MAENEDDSSKTEEPSQKKLDEAKKKGQMVSSREISHFFMLLALAFFVMSVGPSTSLRMYDLLGPFITQPDQMNMDPASVRQISKHIIIGAALIMIVPLMLTWAAAIAPAVVQRKWVFSAEQIKPKFEKISPLAGIKRVFGVKALIEFLKNMAKVGIVGTAAVMIALPYRYEIAGAARGQKLEMLNFTQFVAGKMLVAACIILFLLSMFDYVYQYFSFMKSMRMTKQEMKDEYKQQEGDPHIKGKLRQIRRDKARKRMMAAVPNADVIITNPTHYAVALKYDPKTMPAPKVLAKGVDVVALRIREVAEKHKIVLVRNPPLARVLYDTTEIDDDIPVEHYQAVAKVIGYVYKLKGKKLDRPGTTLHMPTKKKKK
jgi:flagellar biosynthetic protein FlhB